VSDTRPVLKLFLDEGVPDSVGQTLLDAGHLVIFERDAIGPGAPDQLVCAASEANDAILVALDTDMKQIARRRGIGRNRFRTLSLIKLSCRESRASERIRCAMSLIEHEWLMGASLESGDRRIFISIGDSFIRTDR
jgi:predicted nuclease of predicted toxin-antitoxin system